MFYGYHDVSEMQKYYRIADAFLITMVDNEVVNSTLPAKVQSYMLAGRPIIGAINGEVKEIIKKANCGLCCKSLDYQKFAELILEAKKSKKLNEWSQNALKYSEKYFKKDKCINDLIKILNKTTERWENKV